MKNGRKEQSSTIPEYENAIEIRGLCKRYDGFSLRGVDLVVPRGSIMGFVGQNGAGKTTTIQAVLNLIRKEEGSIRVLGLDHAEQENVIKERVAAVFDEIPFHDMLTPRQLSLVLEGIYARWQPQVFQEYLDRFGLPQKKKIGQLSKGMKMKLQIAAALSRQAELLIMDEATAGLDPVVRGEMLRVFLEYMQDENHSILMSSHITSDLEKIADSVTYIHQGRILLSGDKEDILSRHGLLRCRKADLEQVEPRDCISTHRTEYGADVLVADRELCRRKYPRILLEAATLDEILLYYVRAGEHEGGRREWTL